MRHPSSDRLLWEDNKLYYEGEFKVEVVPDTKHPNMFRLKWPDGVLSRDFYNITWARQHAREIAMDLSEQDMEERYQGGSVDAFK